MNVSVMATTPFVAWLTPLMRLHGFDSNKSKLAAYLGAGPSTVNAWFTRGTIPGPELCQKLADVLHVPLDEVMRVAGHVPQLTEERAPYDAMPAWASLLPMLTPGDVEYVGRLVESLAQNPVHPPEGPAREAP